MEKFKSGRKDLTGKKFGRLVAIKYAFTHKKQKKAYWQCVCDCGNTAIICGTKLSNGSTQSCGCLHKEILLDRITKHDSCHTRLYMVWQDMNRRCYDKSRPQYKDWGGRGIIVCDEWLAFDGFKSWAIENGYKDNLTIERMDNNKNYCPGNCTFIPKSQQSANRRNSVFLTLNGQTKILAHWSRDLGIHRETIKRRIKLGWPIERVLSPIIKGDKHHG